MKKVLVVSPHADDETLGAGGTLLKYLEKGYEIFWINVTNAKKEYGYSEEEEKQGVEETTKVALAYNMKEFVDLGLEPAGLDKYSRGEIIGMFSKIVSRIQPNIIILPYGYDVHSDHQIVFETMYSCTKTFRYPSIEKILCMEIISETDYAVADNGFVPNYFVDISDYIDKKIKILLKYKNEIKESPFPRNVEAVRGLAKFRGAGCNVGYAEAFRVIREIEY